MEKIEKIYKNNKIYYKGYTKNNKKNGSGILYNSIGKKIYQGEWKDDKKNGFGIEYINEHISYRGFWKDDEKNGKGIEYYKNGLIKYNGFWKKNFYNGEGFLYNDDGEKIYEGSFLNGKRHGKGAKYIENIFYENEWFHGKEKELPPLPNHFHFVKNFKEGGFGTLGMYIDLFNNNLYVGKRIQSEIYAKLQYTNLNFLKKKNLCKEYFICPEGIYKPKTGKGFIVIFNYLSNYKELNTLYNTKITLSKKKTICKKLIKQLQILHKYGLIHGDIKSRNILIRKTPLDVRIVDFGISIITDKSKPYKKYKTIGYTKKYITISTKKKYNFDDLSKNDFNALYLVMFHLLSGKSVPTKTLEEKKNYVDSILYH